MTSPSSSRGVRVPSSFPPKQRPSPPLGGRRPGAGGAVLFHLGGLVLCIAAAAAAGFAAVLVSFGTSQCNAGPAVVAHNLRSLRFGLAVVGVLLALVPAAWAALASRLRFAWFPWALVAGGSVLLTLVAVSTAEVGTWCF